MLQVRHAGVTLESGALCVQVEPERGMTLTSLVAGGRELLWTRTDAESDGDGSMLGEPGKASAELLEVSLKGGWFEMSPNAGLPDRPGLPHAYMHGEAVRRSWRVRSQSAAHVEADLRLSSEPIALRRRVDVRGDTVLVTSELQNLGSESRPVSPGEHPCFRRDVFGGGSLTVHGRTLSALAVPHTIPIRADSTSGTSAVRLTDSRVVLRARDGLEVVMHVDLDAHPHLGIWWNFSRGEGSGIAAWDTIAIEPLTRFHDEVLLPPGATYSSRTVVEVRLPSSRATTSSPGTTGVAQLASGSRSRSRKPME